MDMMNSMPAMSGTSGMESSAPEVEREDGNKLGKDAFFELLITQMKTQDPLDPMDDRDYLAQMAQFSSLEQMQNLNDSFADMSKLKNVSEGASLIGKTVESIEKDDDGEKSKDISGVVERIEMEDGETYAVLDNEQSVKVDDITAIL
ncbi:MAG: flagellar hook capping FlgD N-terminal domain-containing protein [Bacillota bacterium]